MRLNRDLLSNRGLLGLLLVLFLHYVLLLPAPSAASPLADSVDLLDTLNLTGTLKPPVLAKRFFEAGVSGPLPERKDKNEVPPPTSDYPDNERLRAAFLSDMKTRRFVFFSKLDLLDDNGRIVTAGSTVARNFARGLTEGGAFFRDCYPDLYTKRSPVKSFWLLTLADGIILIRLSLRLTHSSCLILLPLHVQTSGRVQ
jgi:hypothetical protein